MPLGEFLTLRRGYDLPSSHRKAGTVPVISSSGITGQHDTAKIKGPGVVTGRYGTLGAVYFIKNGFWPLNTSLYVCDFKGNDPRFTAYFLGSVLSTAQRSEKAAVPGVNRNHLHMLPIQVTRDVDQQRKIASFLSAYDDLIENNCRRMRLLERAARLLYQEWFVRYHFPGHERVCVTNGVPDGWERKRLGEVAPFRYGRSLKNEHRIPGDYPVYGSSGVIGSHREPLIAGPAIVVGRKGNVGSVFWSQRHFYPIDTVYYIESDDSSLFLYHALRHTAFINSDAAVPGLNRNFAHSRTILFPTKELFELFEQYATKKYEQINLLTRSNDVLAQARDMLLPRLMSGRIAV